MTALNVADILKVGLSGLVFLLAFLSYRLLHEAVRTRVAAPVLSSVKLYLGASLVLTVVVGAFGLVDTHLRNDGLRSTSDLAGCRDSLARLDTQSKLPGVSAEDLKNGISGHVNRCRLLLETNDDR
jgi:hypothetical protein